MLPGAPSGVKIYIATGLLLFSIAVRAAGSGIGLKTLPHHTTAVAVLGIAACSGKILGGIIADRKGWLVTADITFAAGSL